MATAEVAPQPLALSPCTPILCTSTPCPNFQTRPGLATPLPPWAQRPPAPACNTHSRSLGPTPNPTARDRGILRKCPLEPASGPLQLPRETPGPTQHQGARAGKPRSRCQLADLVRRRCRRGARLALPERPTPASATASPPSPCGTCRQQAGAHALGICRPASSPLNVSARGDGLCSDPDGAPGSTRRVRKARKPRLPGQVRPVRAAPPPVRSRGSSTPRQAVLSSLPQRLGWEPDLGALLVQGGLPGGGAATQ